MESASDLERVSQLFQSGLRFTAESLSEGLHVHKRTARERINVLRSQKRLIIVDYFKKHNGSGGRPHPVYAWRFDPFAHDVNPVSHGTTARERLQLAYERKRNRLNQEYEDALRLARNQVQRSEVKDKYEELLADLDFEKSEADRRRTKAKNVARDLRKKLQALRQSQMSRDSLSNCWLQPASSA